ncbi:hypothetical protein QUA43_12205 [Microcoleus sp. N9_B4]|uniref:hypothetical protein n=1 Tax=Microcoleus sp. N9_B4 TaxID=3055386 RepID=UPI002FD664AD
MCNGCNGCNGCQEEGSSATDCVTDVTDVRKKEEGRRKKEDYLVVNILHELIPNQ